MRKKRSEKIIRTKSELYQAQHEGEIQVFLQPQICVSSGRIYGFEALVRRKHPIYGIQSPNEFLDEMNRTYMMEVLDFFVYRKVCMLMKRRTETGRSLFRVSCNFCRRQFLTPGFAERITEITDEYRIPPRYISLEIIEGRGFTGGADSIVRANVKFLCEKGFTVCLDDCGAGVSSLSDLMIDRIGQIKIDKCVTELIDRENVQILVRGVCQIAQHLRCCVIGEGIETRQQLWDMCRCGVDIIQGYYFYKPMPAAEAAELFDKQKN